jgi:branched-chain amino acid transport system substrate-binding protein
MRLLRFLGATLFAAMMLCAAAPSKQVKIGLLPDLDGPYTDISGKGVIEAAQMAVEDTRDALTGWQVEIVSADTQGKPDIGSAIAQRWLDQEHVDMIAGVTNSAIALALQKLVADRHKIQLITGAASSDLTGKACSAYLADWQDENYMQASVGVSAMAKRGARSWFFITADYAFGHNLQDVTSALVQKAGGQVLGSALHPFGSSDFSSYLLQAQASGAQVIALANGGTDLINTIKQAHEFHIPTNGGVLLPFGMFISDVHSLGLETAQGLVFPTGFYWDLNDATRAWGKRFFNRMGKMPTKEQAEAYSAVRHYLLAVTKVQSTDGDLVMAQMKAAPVDDFFAAGGTVRADGRLMHDVYLVQVKTPTESKGPWDYYKILATIPADQAFRPLAESDCPLVRH